MTRHNSKLAGTVSVPQSAPLNVPNLASKRSPAPAPAKKITRVLLADDHPVVRRGIASCLAKHPNLEIVGEASNGSDALRLAKELTPDVVLMDIDMPHTNGLTVTEQLRKELPNIRVLLLSMSDNPEFMPRIIQSGARGYVLKGASPEELVQAIEHVDSGQTFFSPEVARSALSLMVRGESDSPDAAELTGREREVLIAIAKGLSNKEIACQLNIGTRTVETHRDRLMRRLQIHSVAGLTRYAISKGLIMLREELRR